MKISKYLVIFLIVPFLFPEGVIGQDAVFSQFYAAPLQMNPAMAGTNYAPRIAFNYRDQFSGWTDEGSAFKTYSASFDQFIEPLNSGLGIMILSDDAGNGILKTSRISGIYSYRLQLNRRLFAKFGAEGTFVQNRLDWNRLLFPDQIDPINGPSGSGFPPLPTSEEQPENTSINYFDFTAGMMLYNDVFYGGLTLTHLNTPNESFLNLNDNLNNGLPLRFSTHAGAQFNLPSVRKRKVSSFISPNFLYTRQGNFQQLNAGAYAAFGPVFGGLWYRTTFTNADAAIFLVGIRKDVFKIGYSYDYTISGLAGDTGGTHELSFSINFIQDRTPDLNDCFQMFR